MWLHKRYRSCFQAKSNVIQSFWRHNMSQQSRRAIACIGKPNLDPSLIPKKCKICVLVIF